MFDPAIAAGTAAAAVWTPDGPDPAAGAPCCPLCFRRYRMLVLEGPLRGLPHGVAHAVVQSVDRLIAARIAACPVLLRDSGGGSTMRRAAATGALLVVALEEFGTCDARFAELRRRFTEPAVDRYIEQHRRDDEPWTDDRSGTA